MTSQELMTNFMKEKTIEELRELIPLCTHSVLIDKLGVAKEASLKGCFHCTGNNNY